MGSSTTSSAGANDFERDPVATFDAIYSDPPSDFPSTSVLGLDVIPEATPNLRSDYTKRRIAELTRDKHTLEANFGRITLLRQVMAGAAVAGIVISVLVVLANFIGGSDTNYLSTAAGVVGFVGSIAVGGVWIALSKQAEEAKRWLDAASNKLDALLADLANQST